MSRRINLDDLLEEMARRHYAWWAGVETKPAWDDLEEQERRRHRKAMRVAVFDLLKEQELSVAWVPFASQLAGIRDLTPEE